MDDHFSLVTNCQDPVGIDDEAQDIALFYLDLVLRKPQIIVWVLAKWIPYLQTLNEDTMIQGNLYS